MKSTVRITRDNTSQVIRFIEEGVSRAVRETAGSVEAGAKQRAPVRTGALRDSVSVQEVAPADVFVRVAIFYAVYQELGGRHRAGHPFLVPALEAARQGFMEALRRALAL